MRILIKTLTFLLLILLVNWTNAQVKTVIYDVKSNSITSNQKIPFDELFVIKSKVADENIREVRFKYRIKPVPAYIWKLNNGQGSFISIDKQPGNGYAYVKKNKLFYVPRRRVEKEVCIIVKIEDGSGKTVINDYIVSPNNNQLYKESVISTNKVDATYVEGAANPKKWYYFPRPTAVDDLGYTKEQKRAVGEDEDFFFHAGPFHPNVVYELHFELIYNHGLSKTVVDEVKSSIAKQYVDFLNPQLYADEPSYQAAIDTLSKSINNTLKAKLVSNVPGKVKVIGANQSFDEFQVFDPGLKLLRDKIRSLGVELYASRERIENSVDNLLRPHPALISAKGGYYNTGFVGFINGLGQAGAAYELTDNAKKVWAQALSTSAGVSYNVKMSEMAAILTNPSDFLDLLEGRSFIDDMNPYHIGGNGTQLETYKLLQKFFEILWSDKIETQDTSPGNKQIIGNMLNSGGRAYRDFRENLETLLQEYIDNGALVNAQPEQEINDALKALLLDGPNSLLLGAKTSKNKFWLDLLKVNANRKLLLSTSLLWKSGYKSIDARNDVTGFFLKYLNSPENIEKVLRREYKITEKRQVAGVDEFVDKLNVANDFSLEILVEYFTLLKAQKTPDGKALMFDGMSTEFDDIIRNLNKLKDNYKLRNDAATSKKNYQNSLKLLKSEKAALIYQPEVQNTLYDIISDKRILSDFTKSWWDSKKIHPEIADIENVTYNNMARLLIDGLSNRDYVESLLRGNSKVSGSTIVKSDARHLPSIRLLLGFYRSLNSLSFIDDAGNRVFEENKEPIDGIEHELEIIIYAMESLERIEVEQAKAKSLFPNLLADKAISRSVIYWGAPDTEIKSERNFYIGLDFGFTYAPKLQTMMTYEGVNVYFRPVNKKVPLRSLYGRDDLWKRLSVFVGVTQQVFNAGVVNIDPLIPDLGNLMLGMGFRVNRAIRLNGGLLLFNQKDASPIVEETKVKGAFNLSLSFDVDIATSITNLLKKD